MGSLLTTYKNAFILINPVSGKGDGKEKIEVITKEAKKLGWEGVYKLTGKNRNATQIVKDAIADGVGHIIVCGGDGTIMEVVTAIAKTSVSIGIVPQGTGNLLAQNLGIPLSIEESMRVALLGHKKKIDIGRVNNIYFTIMAGVGFDAEMMKNTDTELKNKFGIIAYFLSAVKSITKSSGRYEVRIDKNKPKLVRAKGILIANLGKIQGGINIIPKTSIDNGVLRIGIIQAKNWYFWLSLIFHAVKGHIHKSESFTLTQGNHVEVSMLGKDKVFECDGNVFPPTNKLVIDIFPKALSVLLPVSE